MEKKILKSIQEKYNFIPRIKKECEELNIKCENIDEKNKDKYIKKIVKKEQIIFKKEIDNLIGEKKIDYGIIIKYIDYSNFYLNFKDDKLYLILDKKVYILDIDLDYKEDFLFRIEISIGHITEFNNFHKKLNKLVKNKTKLIDLKKINSISKLITYDNLMVGQYKVLENYFNNNKFKKQFSNNLIKGFVHNLAPMKLELILKTGGKFINPISGNTYDSERGIYTTLNTLRCKVNRFHGHNPFLLFSKDLANDFGYIVNFGFHYGKISKDSLIKGENFSLNGKNYSAVEKSTIKICNKKKKSRSHEIIFFTDHIKLKDYLIGIFFSDENTYNLFKNMKGVSFKNKMFLLK